MKRTLTFSQFINENVKMGDQGNEVSAIQQKLIDLGLLDIPSPTGYFGAQTNLAVQTFQRKNGLDPDGVVGVNTSPKLLGGVQPRVTKDTPIVNNNKYNQVQISDTLKSNKINLDPSKENILFTVKEEGCAEWVSNKLGTLGVNRQGNAWHARAIDESLIEFNAFQNLSSPILSEMASIFTFINANPKEKVAESRIKSLVQKIIPQQAQIKQMLNVNDIVGMYYGSSENFTKAFFEGATGRIDMGTGGKVTPTYFRRKDTGSPWTPEDLGQRIEFVPGNTLKSGGGFTFNTHLGYVGAIVDGEPIIFHSIHQKIHSTPFSKMNNVKILWVKSGEKRGIFATTMDKLKRFIS